MVKEKPFEELIRLRLESGFLKDFDISWNVELADKNPYLQFREGLGKDLCEAYLSSDEEQRRKKVILGLWYLSRDFRVSQFLAESDLSKADLINDDVDRNTMIEFANRNNLRAFQDLRLASTFDHGDFREEYERKIAHKKLLDFRRKIAIYRECSYKDSPEIFYERERRYFEAIENKDDIAIELGRSISDLCGEIDLE